MISLAKKVGADVPFCCINKPAFVSGIGERLETFEMETDVHILLVKPYHGVSTKLAFEKLDFKDAIHPDCKKMREALIRNDYEMILDCLGNTLEQSAFKIVPEIKKIKEKMLELGMDGVLMSGSGSTVFGITRSEEVLDRVAKEMRKVSSFIRKTKIKDKK